MPGLFEVVSELKEAVKAIRGYGSVVTCPLTPILIPGIVAADAFDADDCFGTIFTVKVPRWGILYSATFWDMDDEGTQVDLELFSHTIAQIASDAAWAPPDNDMLSFIRELNFFPSDDHGASRTAEVTNIGKAYTAPEGLLYIQAVTRSTPNIAAGNMPRVQLQILSFDPEFEES